MTNYTRIVIKIGSSLLTKPTGALDEKRVARFARDIAAIHRKGHEVILVSSGAIAAGRGELGWNHKPTGMGEKQAAAAVGQVRLMERYRSCFQKKKITIAQLLLTREDFENKSRLQNAQATLQALLKNKVIPIINENDTVAVEEIRVGDNDTLAAHVAIAAKANLLILLTDVEGLLSRPPHHGKGEVISHVEKISSKIEALAHSVTGTDRGTGGMMTKLRAAKLVTRKGVAMVIASGHVSSNIEQIVARRSVGTYFSPKK